MTALIATFWRAWRAWTGQKTVQHGLGIVVGATVALVCRVITVDAAIALYSGAIPLLTLQEQPVQVSAPEPLPVAPTAPVNTAPGGIPASKGNLP